MELIILGIILLAIGLIVKAVFSEAIVQKLGWVLAVIGFILVIVGIILLVFSFI